MSTQDTDAGKGHDSQGVAISPAPESVGTVGAQPKLRGFRVALKGGQQSVWCSDRKDVLEVLDFCTGLFDGESVEVTITTEETTQAELDALGDWVGF